MSEKKRETLTDWLFLIGTMLVIAGIALLFGWKCGILAAGTACLLLAVLIAREPKETRKKDGEAD